jgi:hypothetical protein
VGTQRTQRSVGTQRTQRTVFTQRSSASDDQTGRTIVTAHKSESPPLTLKTPKLVKVWKDHRTNYHVSVQVHLLSGVAAKSVTVRVSTDGKSLVLGVPIAPSLEFVEKGVFPHLDYKHTMNCKDPHHFFVLQQHGAVIEHQASVAKLRGQNNPNAPIVYEQRITLPFKCSHTLATSLTDRFFYDQNVFTCVEDGATHLFVELLRDTGQHGWLECL